MHVVTYVTSCYRLTPGLQSANFSYSMYLELLYKMLYLCRIPKGIEMEQALTQLEVNILFDDSTYYYDDDATEADKMMDVVYDVDSDDD